MATAIPFSMTNESITLYHEGKPVMVARASANFQALRSALMAEEWEKVPGLLTPQKFVESWSNGDFRVEGGVTLYRGEPLPGDLSKRLMHMAATGEDPTPLHRFWARLQKNPSYRSVQQLFGFLQNAHIPLTPSGKFLAYKSVTDDFKDHHTKTFDNRPGTIQRMDRNKISDDPDIACHVGFHAGALEYARTFGGGNNLVVVLIDPEHVVCVPKDHSQQKIRICEYRVVGMHGAALDSTIYNDDLPDFSGEEVVYDSSAKKQKDRKRDRAKERANRLARAAEAQKEDKKPRKAKKKAAKKAAKKAPVKTEEKKAEPTPVRVTKAPKAGNHPFDALALRGLMEQTLDDLRQYAHKTVHLVGASKIPGGKSALVSAIMKARKG